MPRSSKTRNWIVRGGWAIADQGLFAFANVLLNVLLARWLPATEYGAFAVAYSLFLLLGAFHTALITEPLLVFGAGKYANQLSYLTTVYRAHWFLAAVGSLLLLIAAIVFAANGNVSVSQALFGLTLAAPFSLLMWLGRRAAYLQVQPAKAAIASAGYLLLIGLGLLTLSITKALTVFTALTSVGIAGAISGLGLWLCLQRSSLKSDKLVDSRAVFSDHLRYGRWASATSILMWVPLNLFFVVLSAMVNLEASASLKALANLVLPLLQANAALGTLLLPALVIRRNNQQSFIKLVRFSLVVFAGGALAYSIILSLLAQPLVHFLYGGTYDSYLSVLFLLLLIPIADGLIMVLSSALRAFELPDRVFWSQLAVAGFVLTLGVFAASAYGIWGAAVSIVIANLIGVAVLGIGVVTTLKHAKTGNETQPLVTNTSFGPATSISAAKVLS